MSSNLLSSPTTIEGLLLQKGIVQGSLYPNISTNELTIGLGSTNRSFRNSAMAEVQLRNTSTSAAGCRYSILREERLPTAMKVQPQWVEPREQCSVFQKQPFRFLVKEMEEAAADSSSSSLNSRSVYQVEIALENWLWSETKRDGRVTRDMSREDEQEPDLPGETTMETRIVRKKQLGRDEGVFFWSSCDLQHGLFHGGVLTLPCTKSFWCHTVGDVLARRFGGLGHFPDAVQSTLREATAILLLCCRRIQHWQEEDGLSYPTAEYLMGMLPARVHDFFPIGFRVREEDAEDSAFTDRNVEVEFEYHAPRTTQEWDSAVGVNMQRNRMESMEFRLNELPWYQ